MNIKFINLLFISLAMNHKQRGEFIRDVISKVRDGQSPYISRAKKDMDWGMYDVAQCHEIADMIDMIRDLVDMAVDRIEKEGGVSESGPGRPPTPPGDVAKVLLLQSYLNVPNRVAEGMIHLFKEKLGLSKTFSYKTIERGYDKKAVYRILDLVFDLTNEPVRDLETTFSVDGSGSPTSVKQNYNADRQRQNSKRSREKSDQDDKFALSTFKKRDYVYKAAIIGVRFKLFASWKSTTDHSIGETTMFPEVFFRAHQNHPNMAMMLGDGIYATRPICKILGNKGVTPRLLPRRNITQKQKGVKDWGDMLSDLSEDVQQWLSEYHMRSISETGFSMVKTRNTKPLSKRLDARKETEDYLRGIVHNIRRLCYIRYMDGIRVDPGATTGA